MIRGFLLSYITISLFLSQANLPFFTHICHGMGTTWTALFKPPKACCGKFKPKDYSLHCQKISANSTTEVDKEPCCEDHVKCVSLSVQFVPQLVKPPVQNYSSPSPLPSLIYGISIVVLPTLEGIGQGHGPPHHPAGRDLLIFLQLLLC